METFSLWSDEVCCLVWDQFTIVSDSSSSTSCCHQTFALPLSTQSRTWVTDYSLRVYLAKRVWDYTWDLTSKLCFPFMGISLTFFHGDAACITLPRLSSSKPPTKSIGNWVLHSLWKNCHTGIIRSILLDDEVGLPITFFSYWLSCIGGEDGKIQMWKDGPLASKMSMGMWKWW